MAYTVKKLSKLSGVSVRTLHYYEEINLLKPAYYGENGYRYYEEKELFLLQQILFFKELGFSLKQIQKVVGRSDFDKLSALYSHRKVLQDSIERQKKLVQTIDSTIKHIQGKKKMKEKEIFSGFFVTEVEKAKGDESYFEAESLMAKNLKKAPKLTEDDYKRIQDEGYDILGKIASLMEEGFEPASDKVQKLIKKHHSFVLQFHNATKEVYKAMSRLYLEHPAFRKQLDSVHKKLAEFMSEAMQAFAEKL